MIYKAKFLHTTLLFTLIFSTSLTEGFPGKRHQNPSRKQQGGGRGPQPWWHNPCGPLEGHHRHAKSKECSQPRNIHKNRLRPLIQQLKSFRVFYKDQSTLIDEYYNKDRNCVQLKKEQYNYSWLPKKPLVKNFRNKQEEALLQFHKEIQIFAVALHRLKETMEPTNFNVSKRNEIIDQISMEMKAVMCELEALVNYTCRNLVVERVPTTYINQFSTNWASSTDLTLMCTQDRGVLTAYKDFIFGWKHVFRNIKRRNEINASLSASSTEEGSIANSM